MSVEERIRRPAACLTEITASGREYFHQARSSRRSRSRTRGSLGLAKGSLGMTTQRRVSPVASKPSQNERRAMSERHGLLHKALTQPPGRRPPALTDDLEPRGRQARPQRLIDALHVPSVGEEREDRATHGNVHVEEQVLEGRQVGAVVRCGQVTRQHDGHVPVEVEARVKPHVAMAPLSEEVEAHRVVEVGEVVAHGDRRRGEDDALHLGQPPAGKVGAHVELLGHEPLGRDAALGARELGRVHIGLVRPLADERNAREEVAKEPRGLPEVGRGRRGLLAQRLGGLRERASPPRRARQRRAARRRRPRATPASPAPPRRSTA